MKIKPMPQPKTYKHSLYGEDYTHYVKVPIKDKNFKKELKTFKEELLARIELAAAKDTVIKFKIGKTEFKLNCHNPENAKKIVKRFDTANW